MLPPPPRAGPVLAPKSSSGMNRETPSSLTTFMITTALKIVIVVLIILKLKARTSASR